MKTIIKSFLIRFERLMMGRKAYKWVLRDWFHLHDLDVTRDILATMRLHKLMEPVVLDSHKKAKVLVIAPHPDDEAIGSGGTLLLKQQAQNDIHVAYMTTGKKDESSTRKQEGLALCNETNFKCTFFGHHSGEIDLNLCSKQLDELLVQVEPNIIFLPFFLDDHDDHRRANEVFMQVITSNKRSFDDIEVWAYQVYGAIPANVIVDISQVIEQKKSLIKYHVSQMVKRDWAHWALGLNAFNSRFLPSSDAEKYAESFFVLPIKEYVKLLEIYFYGHVYYDHYQNAGTK